MHAPHAPHTRALPRTQGDAIKAPLWDVAAQGPAAFPSNAAYVQQYVTQLLTTSFPNLRPQQVQVRSTQPLPGDWLPAGPGQAAGWRVSWLWLVGRGQAGLGAGSRAGGARRRRRASLPASPLPLPLPASPLPLPLPASPLPLPLPPPPPPPSLCPRSRRFHRPRHRRTHPASTAPQATVLGMMELREFPTFKQVGVGGWAGWRRGKRVPRLHAGGGRLLVLAASVVSRSLPSGARERLADAKRPTRRLPPPVGTRVPPPPPPPPAARARLPGPVQPVCRPEQRRPVHGGGGGAGGRRARGVRPACQRCRRRAALVGGRPAHPSPAPHLAAARPRRLPPRRRRRSGRSWRRCRAC